MMKHSDKYRNWFESEKLVSDLMDEAADDIDERDAEIERLRDALKAIRREIKAVCGDWREVSCMIDDLARFALQQKGTE